MVYSGQPSHAEKRLSSGLPNYSDVLDAPEEISGILTANGFAADGFIAEGKAAAKLFAHVGKAIDLNLLRHTLKLYARPTDAEAVKEFVAALGKCTKFERILYRQSNRFLSCMNAFLSQEEQKYGHFAIVPTQATLLGGSFAVVTPP